MAKKNILFIALKDRIENSKKQIHYGWVNDCREKYNINFFGPGYNGSLKIESLRSSVEKFKPDFIYCYDSTRLRKWMPDISEFKDIPKIIVELDTYKHNRSDSWYQQFDKVYCRENHWAKKKSKILAFEDVYNYIKFVNAKYKYNITEKKICKRSRSFLRIYYPRLENSKSWKNVKLFRWSISEDKILKSNNSIRDGKVRFVGRAFDMLYPLYPSRYEIYKKYKKKIKFGQTWNQSDYWSVVTKASALICPTETAYGDFVPAKIVEYAASGGAIITNCNLKRYGFSDLASVALHYKTLEDLGEKLKCNFSKYYNKTNEVIRSHIHPIRYGELFD